jgi:S-adenosyl-L-methionine hydrolase (adenosine-forming)
LSNPRPIVTLTTDFGEGSRYVAAMKGALLDGNPDAYLVDLSHSIPPQDIVAGARFLTETISWFPPGTLHVAVVDPGVGSSRKILYVEWRDQRLLLPDNGLMTCLAEREKPTRMLVLENPDWWHREVAPTFHGRDIFAPVAAHLSRGRDPVGLGPAVNTMETLPLSKASRVGQKIEGEVVEIDSFGNLVTDIGQELLDGVPRDESVRVACDEHETFGIFSSYSEQPSMTLIALVGSGGKLELAIVDDSAAIMLGVRRGAKVTLEW